MLKFLLEKYEVKYLPPKVKTEKIKSIVIRDIKTIIDLKDKMEAKYLYAPFKKYQ